VAKAAIVVLADTETHEGMARVVNALEATKEFKEAQDDVKLIFDGAGTRWLSKLADPQGQLHGIYEAVADKVGVCGFCAGVFGVKDEVRSCGAQLLEEFEGHPSFRQLVSRGYQVITF